MNGPARVRTAGAVSHRSKPVTTSNDTPVFKRCTQCGRELPASIEFFYRNVSGKHGLNSKCIDCKRSQDRAQHPNRGNAAANRARNLTNPDLCNRPNVTKYCLLCRQGQPSTPKHFRRNSRKTDGLALVCRKCEDEQYRKLRSTEYYKVRARGYAQKQRAKRRNATGSFTAADIEAIRKAQGNRCYLCGKKLKKYHIDHFIPIAKGGTNDPGNLRLACPKCNQTKSAKHPFELGILL